MNEEETSERIPYAERGPDGSCVMLGVLLFWAIGFCMGFLAHWLWTLT